MDSRDAGQARLRSAAERFCNWGRWGPDDELGTVNFITPQLIREAATLVRRGAVFSLALPFDQEGPQTGYLLRFNPMIFMLRDGSDAYSRDMPGAPRGIGGADDVLLMPTQSGTQWDALAHMFYDSKMWNGYDARKVSRVTWLRGELLLERCGFTLLLLALMDGTRSRPAPMPATTSMFESLLAGGRYALASAQVTTALGVLAAVGVFGIRFQSIAPVYALETVGLDESGYGLLIAAMGFGTLAAALPMTLITVALAGRLMFVPLSPSGRCWLLLHSTSRLGSPFSPSRRWVSVSSWLTQPSASRFRAGFHTTSGAG